jgi:hypothetical protein
MVYQEDFDFSSYTPRPQQLHLKVDLYVLHHDTQLVQLSLQVEQFDILATGFNVPLTDSSRITLQLQESGDRTNILLHCTDSLRPALNTTIFLANEEALLRPFLQNYIGKLLLYTTLTTQDILNVAPAKW